MDTNSDECRHADASAASYADSATSPLASATPIPFVDEKRQAAHRGKFLDTLDALPVKDIYPPAQAK
jgi:hypothetical protein